MRFALRTGKPDGPFERSLKKLKKYRRAREDIDAALAAMIGTEVPNPPNVSLIPGVGRTVLKVRVASSDMKSGKSGGFRVLLDQRRRASLDPRDEIRSSERDGRHRPQQARRVGRPV